jgi:selenide,water dikinase
MMQRKRLVLLGGGHSHVEVLRRFGVDPLRETELVLVSPHSHATYSGMVPGLIAGHYTRDECRIDVTSLARSAHCRFVHAACTGIATDAGQVFCTDGTTLTYDVLSVDTGGRSPASDTPGAVENALPVRPIEAFLDRWDRLCERAADGKPPRRVAVVGAGAGGIELLLAMQHRLRALAPASDSRFELVDTANRILAAHGSRVRAIFTRILDERGVRLHLRRAVLRVDPGGLLLSGGGVVEADMIVWATGAAAPPWPKAAGLAVDDRGFIVVNQRLQSVSHPQVFASGDIASITRAPRPKSGVYAVRAGPPLAKNLRRMLRDGRLVEWKPQREALALIGTGDRYAVASRGNFAFEGRWVWRWKDRIDRRFIGRYRNAQRP